jgi:hypothetical protein
MLEYILGAGSAGIFYGAYCSYSFYKDLKKTIIKKQAENRDRSKTLVDVFREDGIHLYNAIQPRSGIPPKGDIGTFFLKPTIHMAKKFLQSGRYDKQAYGYAERKAMSGKS